MNRIAILTSAIALLGAGNAFAFDAASGFGPSDAGDQPVPRFQTEALIDRSAVTASIGQAQGTVVRGPVGFSAAMGFGPSDADDQTAPRFQSRGAVDHSLVTASIGQPAPRAAAIGYSAATGFGISDADDQPVPRFQTAR
ncbi:hypothetical protein [Chelativorans intermedius]|uniref:Uncharacterized protein n=1 Tax=Chelativorans intermedius TaxID=515947 RepID=A0ABV6D2Q8_9HYPH|nr:hypothetical protein [Chelativorans intermedius]MCT8997257.1 hypothetical protein [Chelativorans intermedius]